MASRGQAPIGRALAGLLVAVIALYGLIIWKQWTPKLGLDLRGGTSVIMTPRGAATSGGIDKAVDILRQRVNGVGVAESEVVREGDDVVISLPDVGREDALELVGRTARLTFRSVINAANGDPNAAEPTPTPTGTASPSASPSGTATPSTRPTPTLRPSTSATPTANNRVVPPHLLAQASATPTPTASPATSGTPTPTPSNSPGSGGPPGQPSPALLQLFTELDCTDDAEVARVAKLDEPKENIVACSREGDVKYLLGPAEMTGDVLKSATATVQSSGGFTTGAWIIEFETTSKGTKLFADVTTKLHNQQMAIVLDGIVQSAPNVNEPITAGSGVIEGEFKAKEAKDLETVLRYGALPVSFDTSELLTISPTLGDESLRGGVLASVIGLGLVTLYILAYYRGLGLVIVLGSAVFGAINYGLVVLLGNVESVGFTLTLPGIAGLIISVGISADSYVVFFERIKDEVREGRTLRLAVDRAYSSAFRTILAADFVSFLAAATLYLLSVGAVRGFAFTLGMATLLDVVMSWFFARPVVTMLARTRMLRESKALGLRQKRGATPIVEGA